MDPFTGVATVAGGILGLLGRMAVKSAMYRLGLDNPAILVATSLHQRVLDQHPFEIANKLKKAIRAYVETEAGTSLKGNQ